MIGNAMNQTNTTICVNGQDEELSARTLAALLDAKEIGADVRGIAVAVNGAVVPRAVWADTTLHAGDHIEIVRARQGG
jgi:sulfur carrier protein